MPRLVKKYFKAKRLRDKGYSLKEISEEVGIAKSTTSVWFRDYKLSRKALERIKARGLMGRMRSSRTMRLRRERLESSLRKKSRDLFDNTVITKNHQKIFCALLYWCEGRSRPESGVGFVNSDLAMVSMFMKFFRSSFSTHEEKFRACIHLHDYHSASKQTEFWSKISNIPIERFIKPYRKPNTGKRIRENYPGCIDIRYYDARVARELVAIAKTFSEKVGT